MTTQVKAKTQSGFKRWLFQGGQEFEGPHEKPGHGQQAFLVEGNVPERRPSVHVGG